MQLNANRDMDERNAAVKVPGAAMLIPDIPASSTSVRGEVRCEAIDKLRMS